MDNRKGYSHETFQNKRMDSSGYWSSQMVCNLFWNDLRGFPRGLRKKQHLVFYLSRGNFSHKACAFLLEKMIRLVCVVKLFPAGRRNFVEQFW